MIVEGFVNICTAIVKLLFSWITLPGIPEGIQSTFDTYFGYIFDNLGFLSFFFNVNTLKIVASVSLLLYSFKYLYKIVMWLIKKIPLSID